MKDFEEERGLVGSVRVKMPCHVFSLSFLCFDLFNFRLQSTGYAMHNDDCAAFCLLGFPDYLIYVWVVVVVVTGVAG